MPVARRQRTLARPVGVTGFGYYSGRDVRVEFWPAAEFAGVTFVRHDLGPIAQPSEIDFVVFRENTEGAYCGAGGFLKHGTADEVALQDEVNTRQGVERIIVAAFRELIGEGRGIFGAIFP